MAYESGMTVQQPITTMEIVREPERSLTLAHELELARAVIARRPGPPARRRLARLAFLDDDFATVIATLSAVPEPEFGDLVLLTRAWLALETAAGNAAAREAAARALAATGLPAEQAAALADRAKAEVRLGLGDAARATLEQALGLDPHNMDACKRLAALDLAQGRATALAEWTRGLSARGVGHARLHAAQVLAQAACGELAAAHAMHGLAELGLHEHLPPPPGWDDSAAFNRALALELERHPGQRFERYGSASNFTLRIEALARPDMPLVRALIDQIVARVEARVAAQRSHGHPWLAAQPARALLRMWSVMTEGEGFEGWHVHQFGWLSGVYYVQVPDVIARGTDRAGCLAFGLPEDQVGAGAAAAFGTTAVRPEPGLMLTFPSHVYHRTFAHGAPGKRICVAFDLRPL